MNTVSAPRHALAWFEVAVSDLAKGANFYEAVLGLSMPETEMGGQQIRIFAYEAEDTTAISGNLYQSEGPVAPSGSVIHYNVPGGDLEAAQKRVVDNGGEVHSEIFPIPEGKLFYGADPDGNRISLFSRQTA